MRQTWTILLAATLVASSGCADGDGTGDDDTATADDDAGDDDSSPMGDDDDPGDDDSGSTGDDDSAFEDLDGDGWSVDGGDCDDSDPAVNPGAAELPCDGVDNDCDGFVAIEDVDADGDGFAPCDGDCDDQDAAVYPGAPDVIEVPADVSFITDAVDLASDGMAICVSAGTYNELIDFQGKAIRVIGVEGPEQTVIDGSLGADSVVRIDSGEGPDSLLQGFTVTGGSAEYGGGMYIAGSSPTLVDLHIHGNVATSKGGGIHADGSSSLLMNVRIQDNHCDFNGGGAYFYISDPTLTQVVVSGNSADHNGGGLLLWHSDATITHTLLAANTAGKRGGGLHSTSSDAVIHQVLVLGNTAETGGGMELRGYEGPLTHAVLVGNTAEAGGSAIYLMQASDLSMTNVTISSNVSAAGAALQVENCTATPRYCALWNNPTVDVSGITFTPGVDGNLAEDPMFLDLSGGDPLTWDLHLGTTSALVDSAEPSLLDPDTSPGDIGAFGGPLAGQWDLDGDGYPLWWQPGPYDPLTYPAQGWDCDDLDRSVYPGFGC